MAGDPKAMKSTRRKFVNWLLGTSAAGYLAAVVYPIGRYLIPPPAGESSASSVTLPFPPGDVAVNIVRGETEAFIRDVGLVDATDDLLPDLLVVDGGKGQLGVAHAVLKDLGIDGVDLVGLAKSRREGGDAGARSLERIFVHGRKDAIVLTEAEAARTAEITAREQAEAAKVEQEQRLKSESARITTEEEIGVARGDDRVGTTLAVQRSGLGGHCRGGRQDRIR